MKTINVNKQTNSPRGLKQQTELEKLTAKKLLEKVNFKNATIIIEYDGQLYACKMPMNRLTDQLAISGKKAKFLCPLGKTQVIDFIASGDLKRIGSSEDLEKYTQSNRYKVTNNGQAIEYFLSQKYHAKFDHYGKMTGGNGEFRNTEVKFFSFDKTTGTPSATCESIKVIAG